MRTYRTKAFIYASKWKRIPKQFALQVLYILLYVWLSLVYGVKNTDETNMNCQSCYQSGKVILVI